VLGLPPAIVADTFAGLFEGPHQIGSNPGSAALLRRRRCPVLSVWSLRDLGDWDASLSDHPHSATHHWPEAGHWLHQEQPERFNAVVETWLARLDPAS
jgi:pimeloyl-ACP methyl ester carboxylesterase